MRNRHQIKKNKRQFFQEWDKTTTVDKNVESTEQTVVTIDIA